MDAIVARIKEYVLVIDPTIEDNAFLDFVIDDSIDRVLAITNREQFVRNYEEDIVNYPIADVTDINETWYEYWKCYDEYPIPAKLERVIAKTIVSAYKNLQATNSAEEGAIKSIDDHGQKVTYGDKIADFFRSSDDADVFSGSMALLNEYTVPTIINNR